MKLNHLNLTVSDVPQAHRFLEKYFGLKGYHGMEPREGMSFMSDDNGMLLALFRGAKGLETKYPVGFHIGFIQESEEQVDQINQRLRKTDIRSPNPRGFTDRGRFISRRREGSLWKCFANFPCAISTGAFPRRRWRCKRIHRSFVAKRRLLRMTEG